MPTDRTVLRFNKVCLTRGLRVLVQNLDFTVHRGESWTITGLNGAGKTSLLRAAAGLLQPFVGKVWRAPGLRVRYLGHELALKPQLCAAALLNDESLHDWGLEALASLPLRYLSAGQKKRVALALRCRPGADLWLLDEPFANLDTVFSNVLEAKLQDHCAQDGAVLCTSHRPVLADKRLRLEAGLGHVG